MDLALQCLVDLFGLGLLGEFHLMSSLPPSVGPGGEFLSL